MPTAHAELGHHRGGGGLDRRRAASRRWCRTASRRRRPRPPRPARSAARSRGRRPSRRRSARRRRRRSCPRRRGRRRTPRSCAGSRRGRRARPSRGAGPRSCRRACRPARRTRRAGAAPGRVGAHVAAPGHAEGAMCAVRNVSRASRPKNSASLGLEAGSRPRSADAEVVEDVGDAQLLLGGERHALALHAVAQGAVVDDEVVTSRGDLLEVQRPRSCRPACRRARTTPPARAAPGRRRRRCRAAASSRTPPPGRAARRVSSRANSSASLGFEAGKPASIIGTPRSSRRCATRSFSSTDSDIPSPCIPSRRVVS